VQRLVSAEELRESDREMILQVARETLVSFESIKN
jgi:hypothetical protein